MIAFTGLCTMYNLERRGKINYHEVETCSKIGEKRRYAPF